MSACHRTNTGTTAGSIRTAGRRLIRGLAAASAGLLALASIGCVSDAQFGGLAGAGLGALAGQAIGGDTEATLIGTAVGAGLGYAVGNESDKARATYSPSSAPAPATLYTRPAPRPAPVYGSTSYSVTTYESGCAPAYVPSCSWPTYSSYHRSSSWCPPTSSIRYGYGYRSYRGHRHSHGYHGYKGHRAHSGVSFGYSYRSGSDCR